VPDNLLVTENDRAMLWNRAVAIHFPSSHFMWQRQFKIILIVIVLWGIGIWLTSFGCK
jgi:hypothetical protein